MKKEYYLELMEKTLSAYSTEHIKTYFNQVKTEGLKEHGFPRLTANIGIMIAHGKRKDRHSLFRFYASRLPSAREERTRGLLQ